MSAINIKEKKRRKKKKRPPHKSKMITGYIIYASEIRKEVIKKYPDRDFGDISKLVGIEWKNLPQETKVAYEKRAQEQNAKSKAIAAEALELKKLADAAEERAAKEQALAHQVDPQCMPANHNGTNMNGYSHPIVLNHNHHDSMSMQDSSQSPMFSLAQQQTQSNQQQQYQCQQQQQSPMIKPTLQIIQQHQQPTATTIQYCNSNGYSSQVSQQQSFSSQSSPLDLPQTPVQYQKNNIVYRKPATVKLRPKDASTQTDPITWLSHTPKKPLRFSQKFIDYLSCERTKQDQQQQQQPLTNVDGDSLPPPPQLEASEDLVDLMPPDGFFLS